MRAREFVKESIDADQVLDYVKRTHAPEKFDIEYSITDHPKWELESIPLSKLKLDPDGEAQDPYGRVNWVDYDKVRDLVPKIGSVLKSRPIVVDSQGWIIDGNHRAMAAVEAELTSVPALVPVDLNEGLKSKLAGAALAGGMALGAGGANAMDWKDAAMTGAMFVPGIGPAVKAYNVGKSLYQAGAAAKQYRDADKDLKTLAAQQKSRPNQSSTVDYDPNYKAEIEPVDEDVPQPGDFKLMGQNLFLKNLARNLKQRYPDATVKLSSDRVTAYHNKGDDEALTVMGTEVMDSGYIGVGLDDAFTESFQGVLVPTIKQTTEQLLAANPGTKPALFLSTDNWNPDAWNHIATKLGYRLVADDEPLDENFADGKVKGKSRPGRVKRAGASCAGSVTDLRAKAKKYGGERGRMYHWCANMKGGRKK